MPQLLPSVRTLVLHLGPLCWDHGGLKRGPDQEWQGLSFPACPQARVSTGLAAASLTLKSNPGSPYSPLPEKQDGLDLSPPG